MVTQTWQEGVISNEEEEEVQPLKIFLREMGLCRQAEVEGAGVYGMW